MAGDFVLFSYFKRKLYPSSDFASLWSKGRVCEHVKDAQEFSQLPHLSAHVIEEWFSLLPIFLFLLKIISSQPSFIALFLELLVVSGVCTLAFRSLSRLCEIHLSRRHYFQLAQTFWPQLFRPEIDSWPKVKWCKFVQSHIRSKDQLDKVDSLLGTWK